MAAAAESERNVRTYRAEDLAAVTAMLVDRDPWRRLGYTAGDWERLLAVPLAGREGWVIERSGRFNCPLTLSDPACGAGTMVTFMHTTTITNLTRTTSSGAKIVIPSSSGSATTNYIAGQLPSSVAITMDGTMQIVGVGGAVTADRSFSGDISIVPSPDRSSYTSDGVMTLQDQADNTATTLTARGLNRSDACCRPSGGTLTIDRATGANSGTHTWTFGPSCGAIMFDGAAISAPSCM